MRSIRNIDFYFIDDDLLYLSFFRKQFKPKFNFNLYTFSSSDAFLNKLKRDQNNNNLKVVIIDYVLNTEDPDSRSGLELIPIIKEIDEFAEVIILSGYDNMDVKATGSTSHPLAFIQKNDHTFVRLDSVLNTLISTYEIKRRRFDIKVAYFILAGISLVAIISFLVAFLWGR
ncbi:MAG: hypothetical protein GX879_00345 [Bacteroidales bacterium]|nr:hypothetical protein [Bacteroidales bacterium]